jgi:hypothetical protein
MEDFPNVYHGFRRKVKVYNLTTNTLSKDIKSHNLAFKLVTFCKYKIERNPFLNLI